MKKYLLLTMALLLLGVTSSAGVFTIPSAEAQMSLIVAGGGTPAAPDGDIFTADETWNFDDNSFSGLTDTSTANMTMAVSDAAALNGSAYGVVITATADTGDGAYLSASTATDYSDEVGFRFHLKILDGASTTFNGKIVNLLNLYEDSQFEAEGQIQLYYSSGWSLRDSKGTNAVALSTDTDYEIMVRFVYNDPNSGFQVWVNDVKEIDDLNYTASRSYVGFFYFGIIPSTGNMSSGSVFYLDDLQVGTITP